MPSLKFGKRALPPILGGAVALTLAVSNGIAASGSGAAATPAASLKSTAVDMSEDSDQYTVTIPTSAESQTNMDIRLDGQTLHIGSGASASGARFEQTLLLPEADASQSPKLDKRADKLVVTVPKARSGALVPKPSSAAASGGTHALATASPVAADANMDAWSQHVMAQFQQMQQRMDRMMNMAMGNMGQPDPFGGTGPMLGGSAFGGGINVQDEGKDYIIRADIPGITAQNVNVSVDDDHILRITAKNESSGSNRFQSSNFTQMLTLPGPVQPDKIQVSQENDGVVITLPKA